MFAASLAALDLVAKSGLSRMLPSDEKVDLRIIELRVVDNPGGRLRPRQPASELADPRHYLLTAVLAGYAWQVLPRASRILAASLTLTTAGALANLLDRNHDGLVTDYLHTGWLPTFNLADCLITLGAVGAVLGLLREAGAHERAIEEPAG